MADPTTLSDDALVERIDALAAASRATTAELIAHLVELERRDLHLACGFKSLFGYCRRVLRCSEAAAYDRMQAAHAAARFPVILAMLADGLLHLTAVRLLAPHLKDADHLALLGAAMHKSGREVRTLLAGWFPRPDVREGIRKLPERGPAVVPPPAATATTVASIASSPPETARAGDATGSTDTAGHPREDRPATPAPVTRPAVSALSPGRYEFRFTGDEETVALFREARELLSHSLPGGDMAAIVKRGLALVVAEARRRTFAATDRSGPSRPLGVGSRTIPAGVRRETWRRDDGQCSFVGTHGRRCEERRFLEFHHLKPWAVGGLPTADNIALRCRAHNQYEARRYFAPSREAMAPGG